MNQPQHPVDLIRALARPLGCAPARPPLQTPLEEHATATSPGSSVELLAELRSVEKRYGKTLALDGVDLAVRRGEILAVLGPNGAGKSTAISLWLGLTQPNAGTVRLLGGAPSAVDSRRGIGVMMQEVVLAPGLRVRELIDLTASYYPEPLSVPATLELTGTQMLASRRYGRLSAGQKRQAQFALAVCGRPTLLFLDEPTVGLDVEARSGLWRTIRELRAQGCSIVLTTHYLEEAEALADRVAVLAHGRLIASGSVDEIRSLVSRKQISCSSSLPADEVRGWPSVVSVAQDARRLHITAIDAETVVRRLLAADDQVRDLEVRQAGLAEAFAQLTKEAA
jgi:ABC-type multidrug transport system ATPase subunit